MRDLIDRQAAIDEIRKCRFLVDAIEKIRGLPSAQPEQKKGRWIRTTKADYAWECSACGYGLCDNRTTYCYDCGARMDSEEKNETLPHVD